MARIVVLSRRSVIHPRGGGACRYVHEIFRRLTDSHSITVLSSGGGGLRNKSVQEIDGIEYRHFPEPFHRIFLPARYLAKFAGKTDLLIDNSDVGMPWLTPLYTRIPRITIVHQLVREIFYQELPRPLSDIGFFAEPLMYRLYSRSRVVAVSQSTARELMEFGIPKSNVEVVSPGCTLPSHPRTTLKERSPNTVACVTRLMKYKGVQLAFMAFRRIVRESPEARLVIAGSGPYQTEGTFPGREIQSFTMRPDYSLRIPMIGLSLEMWCAFSLTTTCGSDSPRTRGNGQATIRGISQQIRFAT